jgi:hypothetical protein
MILHLISAEKQNKIYSIDYRNIHFFLHKTRNNSSISPNILDTLFIILILF